MDIHEQEDRDYRMGMGSELENAYARSCMERTDDTDKISALLAKGRFVVVCEGTAYCHSTDAIIGTRRYVIADYATEAEAEKNELLNDPEPDPEVSIRVFRPVPGTKPPPVTDVPF